MDFKKLEEKLIEFLQSKQREIGVDCFIVGISGGLDSAVVSALCAKSDIKTYGYILPTSVSSAISLKDAVNHCDKFDIEFNIINIDSILSAYANVIDISDIHRMANLSARVRANLLYDRSFFHRGIVVGTSNLSERVLGYGTIYGDLACAINPIGNILKTDLFSFATHLNINEAIISKPPSAELYDGQSDESEFGYKYEDIDKIIKIAIKNSMEFDNIIGDINLINFVKTRYENNKFKLKMPTIAEF
ncbi:MAG: NAD(+) synthase [Campylobacter sp.]|nr:NAD(+) synthase [Campylobacter sp.]